MKFLIYELYHQSPKIINEIYLLKKENFLAILIDNLPKSKEERIRRISELKREYKLKLIEITQNQFLNFIKNENTIIKEIDFENTLETEDNEEICDFINQKKNIDLVNKIKKDNSYYYISSIKIELKKENLILNFKKNLEIEVIDNSFESYSKEKIFKILEEENVISTLVNQEDKI